MRGNDPPTFGRAHPGMALAADLVAPVPLEFAVGGAEVAAGFTQRGASLLAAGVQSVSGQFERGAAVAIRAPDGRIIAKGVTAYGTEDIRRIAGRRTEEAEAILGYRGRPAIIHRDDMVRL